MTVTERDYGATDAVGFWSAVAVSLLVAGFGTLLVVGLWLDTLEASFAVCLVLAPAFVSMMASIHRRASGERQVWSLIGLCFAVAYSVLVTITYFTQLTVVRSNAGGLTGDALRLIEFAPGSWTFALDMLGYAFMTLATLAAAPVFDGSGLERWLRIWFILHGSLVVPTLLTPALIGPSAEADQAGSLALIGWSALFLPLSVMVAVWFRRRALTTCEP
jgi:hypothetical protein